MADLPQTFAENVQDLPPSAARTIETAKADLEAKGYKVVFGLTKEYATALVAMCREPHILATCPNDSGSRFSDLEATEKWLTKNGGRAVFLLLRISDGVLAGYGWTGAGTSPHAQGGTSTFAIRVGEIGLKQGLATPFSQLIVHDSALLFGCRDFWLETWESNAAGVHVYTNLGFEMVDTVASGDDNRLFMTLPNQILLT